MEMYIWNVLFVRSRIREGTGHLMILKMITQHFQVKGPFAVNESITILFITAGIVDLPVS